MDKQINKVAIRTDNIRITKTSYEEIAKSIKDWPQWKKKLCNQELIISVKAKKI